MSTRVHDQDFLAMLAKDHSIKHQGTLKMDLLQNLSAVGKPGNISFDLGVTVWGDPKGIEVILTVRP